MKVIGAVLCVLAANFCFSEGSPRVQYRTKKAVLTVELFFGRSIYIESGKIKTWFPCSGSPTSKWHSLASVGCEMRVARVRRSRTNRNMRSYRAIADVLDRDCLTKTLCETGEGFTGTKNIYVKTRKECGNTTTFCGYQKIYTFKTTFHGVRHKSQNTNHRFLSLNIEKLGGGRTETIAVLNGGSLSLQAAGTVTIPCQHVAKSDCMVNSASFARQGGVKMAVQVEDDDCVITDLCYKKKAFTGSKQIKVKYPNLDVNGKPTGSYKSATTYSAYFGWILKN